MINNWIRKNILINFMTLLSMCIICFFIIHIFFGERSLWKYFDLKNDINKSKEEFNLLIKEKKYVNSQIQLLRDDNLDSDIISEISNKLLGLIHSDQIVIDISK